MQSQNELLDRIEHQIAVDGLTPHDPELAVLADLLVRTGTLPTIAGILSDPSQPEPARMRALARAIQALRTGPRPLPALVA